MKVWYFSLIILIFFVSGCGSNGNGLEKAGILLPHPIDDQGWNSKGYQGMLNIQSTFDIQVIIKEDIHTEDSIFTSVKEMDEEGVTLIFGHSSLYADYFMELKDQYPHIHFVSFNGEVEGENVTSVHFEGYAMGYFAGLLSSEMTKTNQLGIIAAFSFQPEVQGFKDGAVFNREEVSVTVEFVESWVDSTKAIKYFHRMKEEGVDVFYPAGDGFHVEVVEEVKRSGLFAIGYVGDHYDLGEQTILTSTVQHVEKLYEKVVNDFIEGKLESGNHYYDFADEVISLGEYGINVPDEKRDWIEKAIKEYIETGKFPHELK
ncbi:MULTISPECIES: BMP family ABC transporter substrate-binding protein [Bacillaceae]|uniref:BMP family ABC transporter substrate-binding protein n=1 Tax=Evansella alkalicola TaxID=745819 RepID=A0ABS6JTA1_9BACI|nr:MULTISPECIES: BMP family ABC transporter substrate-binding protein [Bacillaceae]MBU9721805.1 BMP family ABC transporter substrate-binding protein [Bacillus alkalicola]